ncbi:MAG TPA: hypothetical protein VFI13_03210, partial [Gemmatimonadales bacterium]|nr:hypothetical protein [Gemmatimonadales bacterium]
MRLASIVVLALFASPLCAQGPGGMGGDGFGGRGMGGRPMMGRRRPADAPSEDLLRGPFVPDSMITKFALDTVQGARYRAAWDSMMA